MRQRYARPLWVGVAASVLLHAFLLGGVNWTLPQWRDASDLPAIEARLPPPPPVPAPPASQAKPPSPPRPRPVVSPAPPPEPALPEAVADAPAIPEAVEPAAVAAPEGETSAPVPVAEEPRLPPLNPLPQRIDMEYRVSIGPASGRQNVVWINEGERYTVTSVTAATGFTSLIYSGRFVQTSRGQITPRGLVPQEFWDQRGDKHSSARFDQGQLTLTSSRGGAPRHFAYPDGVQDALSLLFHLALTAPPADGAMAYTVFNGKKLRGYAYEVRGEETLETALGPLRTLHLARRMNSDGRFEVWLAIDRHYLPVRVLRVDDSGAEGELTIASIASSE